MHLVRMKPYNKRLGDLVRSWSYKRNRFFSGVDGESPSILYVVKDDYVYDQCMSACQEGDRPERPIFEEIVLEPGQTLSEWVQDDFEERVNAGWPPQRTKVQGDPDLIKELNHGSPIELPKPKHKIYQKKTTPTKRYRSTKKRSLVSDGGKETIGTVEV